MADRFIVEDNPDRSITKEEEIKIHFVESPHYSKVWTMTYEDLIDLQTTIKTYLADG